MNLYVARQAKAPDLTGAGSFTINPGEPKGRLDGQVTGTGPAWVFTNGKVTKGTWQKDSFTAPTLLFKKDGTPKKKPGRKTAK